MPVAARRTLGYGRVGNCMLYVSSKKPPAEPDWAEYVEWFRRTFPPGSTITSLVYERSSGPNATQRKQINDMTARCSVRAAVLAVSPVARGILTALSWFKEGYKAFNPHEVDAAVSFLELSGMAAAEVKAALRKMTEELED